LEFVFLNPWMVIQTSIPLEEVLISKVS